MIVNDNELVSEQLPGGKRDLYATLRRGLKEALFLLVCAAPSINLSDEDFCQNSGEHGRFGENFIEFKA